VTDGDGNTQEHTLKCDKRTWMDYDAHVKNIMTTPGHSRDQNMMKIKHWINNNVTHPEVKLTFLTHATYVVDLQIHRTGKATPFRQALNYVKEHKEVFLAFAAGAA